MKEFLEEEHIKEQIQAASELLGSLTVDQFKSNRRDPKIPFVWIYRLFLAFAVFVAPIIWFLFSHYVNSTYATKEETRTSYVSKEEMAQYQMTLTSTLKSFERNLDTLTITQTDIGKNQQTMKEVLVVLASKADYDKVQDARMQNIEQSIQKNFEIINASINSRRP